MTIIRFKDISEIDIMVCGKSPTGKHELKDCYSGLLKEVGGDVSDSVKYEGTFCVHCGCEFRHETSAKEAQKYADYLSGIDPLDPRD